MKGIARIVEGSRRSSEGEPLKSFPGEESSAASRFPNFPEIERLIARGEELLDSPEEDPYFHLIEEVDGPCVTIGGRPLVSYASYDYLGLSQHPEVKQSAIQAIEKFGTGTNASRLVAGQRPPHLALESGIAEFLGTEAALSFVSGFATNESLLGHLAGKRDLILIDAEAHRSIRDGAKLSGAQVLAFEHNNSDALEQVLDHERTNYRRCFIVIEGLYSMDGDFPELPDFVAIKQRYDCLLLVDEAHSLGVLGPTGRGITEQFDVPVSEVDLIMGTLSKSCGGCGGFLAGAADLLYYLRYTVPGFVFSVGMPPATAAAASTALSLIDKEPERVARLRANCQVFANGLQRLQSKPIENPLTPIFPLIAGSSRKALAFFRDLGDRGVFAPPILHPAVPRDTARLRFFLSSTHTTEQIEGAIEAIEDVVRIHGPVS